MDMKEKAKRFEELMKNEELAKEFFSNDSAEAAQHWLAEHGVDFTVEEVKMIAKIVKKAQSGEISQDMIENGDEELSDDELSMVAGGFGIGLLVLGIIGATGGLGAIGFGGWYVAQNIDKWLR